ncbi:MAG: hypothetical protein AB1Z98_28275 [Nannocystaceae bacterium]
MSSTSLLRLLASLGLLCLFALPACKAKGPASYPAGGSSSERGYSSGGDSGRRYESAESAPAPSDGPLATRGRSTRARNRHQPSPPPGSSQSYESEAGYGQTYEEPSAVYDYDDAVATAPRRDRPGLGTSYGEQHFSRITTAPFVRGSSQPDVLLSLWYNDPEGVRMAQGSFGRGFDQPSQASTSDGVFVVSVVDEWGNVMPAADVGNKRYVVGDEGQRYKLRVSNNSAFRFEVVASVDGLDVIDGEPGSFAKRGYILDPWASITIDGWRTSEESIAAFRFSGMEDSYAERTGQGRNIGVMGFAFFHERGGVPWAELQRRDSADPFPQRFAEPPPRRRWR